MELPPQIRGKNVFTLGKQKQLSFFSEISLLFKIAQLYPIY